MPHNRYFALSGTSTECDLCEVLGLAGSSRKSVSDENFAHWLVRANYSHFVVGCGVSTFAIQERFQNLLAAGLKPLTCVHRGTTTRSEYETWLVEEELTTTEPLLHLAHSVFWIPRKTERALASQLRELPLDLHDRLHVHWPHPSLLAKWGWQWNEVLRTQEHLANAFPYLKWRLPSGWDLFNPDIDCDLELEPLPQQIIDYRGPEQKSDISIVIPTYNNSQPLGSTVKQVLRSAGNFEVIVVDDGSSDQTKTWFENEFRQTWPSHLVYVRLNRPKPRQMGEGGFRAGVARNVGVTLAKSKLLLFLDSDILLPPQYLNELIALHQDFDVIQATRRQLTTTAPMDYSADYSQYSSDDFELSPEIWESFYRSSTPWGEMPHKWKFTSTFCLSLKTHDFIRLGKFRRSFHRYGFEDTDLGYRAALANLRFFRSSVPVYHFRHCAGRSEYGHSNKEKQKLLRESARIFFLNNPDRDVLTALPHYLFDRWSWRDRWI